MIINLQYAPAARTPEPEKTQLPGRSDVISGRRYYNPRDGRFIGRDPIEEKGGLHLYAFCLNNPITKWDVLGKYTDFFGREYPNDRRLWTKNDWDEFWCAKTEEHEQEMMNSEEYDPTPLDMSDAWSSMPDLDDSFDDSESPGGAEGNGSTGAVAPGGHYDEGSGKWIDGNGKAWNFETGSRDVQIETTSGGWATLGSDAANDFASYGFASNTAGQAFGFSTHASTELAPTSPGYFASTRQLLTALTKNSTVSSAMEKGYFAANPLGPDRKENGFWIQRDNKTGAISIIQMPIAGATRDSMPLPPPPKIPGQTTIAWEHVHPNPASDDYVPGASSGDVNYSWKYGIPGIIREYIYTSPPTFFGPSMPPIQ